MKVDLIIAHRGFHQDFPENTIESIQNAVDHGLQMVELDVRRTKDGGIYIFHDRSLKRLAGIRRYFAQTPSQIIEDAKINGKFKIPRLDEVFRLFSGKIHFLLDIKKETMLSDNLEEGVLKLVRKFALEKDCLISSFNYFVIKKISKMNFPNTGIILAHPWQLYFLNYNLFTSIHVNYFHLNHPLVIKWIEQRKDLFIWNIPSNESISEIQNRYPDAGIITDIFPDFVLIGNKTIP